MYSNPVNDLIMDVIDNAVLQLITYGTEKKYESYKEFMMSKIEEIKNDPTKLQNIEFLVPVMKSDFLNAKAPGEKMQINNAITVSLQNSKASDIKKLIDDVNSATNKAKEMHPISGTPEKEKKITSMTNDMLYSTILGKPTSMLGFLDDLLVTTPGCNCENCLVKKQILGSYDKDSKINFKMMDFKTMMDFIKSPYSIPDKKDNDNDVDNNKDNKDNDDDGLNISI